MRRRQFLRLLPLLFCLPCAGCSVPLEGAAVSQVPQDLPDPSEIERAAQQFQPVRLYDRTGTELLWEFSHPMGSRIYVPLERIPTYLQHAVIALEDRDFYVHPGVDPKAVVRAALANLRGEGVQGASTIAMQLAKNLLLSPDERYELSMDRKLKEAMLALELTRRYPREKILEWYLNTNFYGCRSYGVEAAARTYFGKHVWELSLAEAAMIAPIPQNPSINPFSDFVAAKRRQEMALDVMAELGCISAAEAAAAKAEPLSLAKEPAAPVMRAPHFALYVKQLLEERYGELLYMLGLRVRTSLSLPVQELAERVAKEKVAEYEARYDAHNAAVVVIAPESGEILAMVGSVDYNDERISGQVNMALAPRQTGSSFKPYVYLAALESGYTAATMLLDIPASFPNPYGKPYAPKNIDGRFHGAMRMRRALACSYNVPAVRMLSMLGVEKARNMAVRLGIALPEGEYGLSFALGTAPISLLEHTFAYAALASGGRLIGQQWGREQRPRPAAILAIADAAGNQLYEYVPRSQQVVLPEYAYILTSILSDATARLPAFGASAANLVLPDRPVAAKTGSTDGYSDAWTMGYTPQFAVGVWVGNTDRRPMKGLLGSTGAGPIFHEIMLRLHEGQPVREFPRPPRLVELEICDVSGLLPGQHCPRAKELFFPGTEPTETCRMHVLLRVNKETGEPATADTPADKVVEQLFEIYPPEGAQWAQENGIAQPPAWALAATTDPMGKAVSLLSPQPGQVLSGVVTIVGTATATQLWYHKVEYSADGANWTTTEADYMKTERVFGGALATWDTRTVPNGRYYLRAVVVDITGNYLETAPITVTVQN